MQEGEEEQPQFPPHVHRIHCKVILEPPHGQEAVDLWGRTQQCPTAPRRDPPVWGMGGGEGVSVVALGQKRGDLGSVGGEGSPHDSKATDAEVFGGELRAKNGGPGQKMGGRGKKWGAGV